MASVLFETQGHRCIVFSDLVRGDDGIQANQFLIEHGRHSALIDPGGVLLYTPLSLAMSRYVQPTDLDYILATHQDPDVIGAVDRWLLYTPATIVCSRLWGRFVPHSVPHYQTAKSGDRYLLLGDEGGRIALGDYDLLALPAHFLHSVGNFSFYDPLSGILFSGDIGASLVHDVPYQPVTEFATLIPSMEGFHRRYMASRKATRLWVDMVRRLQPTMIVPQHGLPIAGAAVPEFFDWLSDLECGIDLLDAGSYQLPSGMGQRRPTLSVVAG